MKHFTFTFLLATLSLQTQAQTISKEQALSRARDFIIQQNTTSRHQAPLRGGEAGDIELEAIPSTLIVPSDSVPTDLGGQAVEAFYVVKPTQSQESGYVVVSGDQRMAPILGYSSMAFDLDEMPCALRAWLTHYATELRDLKSEDKSVINDEMQTMAASLPTQDEGMEPLIKTTWGQYSPYNKFCPNPIHMFQPCLTGCVATALAQILYYYQYPKQGVGTYSYYNRDWNTDFSADFGNTTYDWDNMQLNYSGKYTEQQADAVATLMYHCGVISNMLYNYGSSASSGHSIVQNSINHLGYDADAYMVQGASNWETWHKRILFELSQKRPILYCASRHCFVLDGYRMYKNHASPYYHMNMGWDGNYGEDYYLLTALPDLNQSLPSSHEMIIGFQPEDGLDLPLLWIACNTKDRYGRWVTATNMPTAIKHDATGTQDVQYEIRLKTSALVKREKTEPQPGILRLMAVDQNGKEIMLHEFALDNTNQYSISTIEAKLTLAQLPVGHYRMEWRIYAPGNATKYNLGDTSMPTMITIYDQAPKLTVTSTTLPPIIDALDNKLLATVRNDGKETYYGRITMQLTNENATQNSLSSGHLTLAPGQSTEIDFSAAIIDLVGGPVTVTWYNELNGEPLLNTQGAATTASLDTRPIRPTAAIYELKPQITSSSLSTGLDAGMLVNYGELPAIFSKMAAVALDDDDNILSIMGEFSQEMEYEPYYGNRLSGCTMRFRNVNGELPNGNYKVGAALQQKNSDTWTLVYPNYSYKDIRLEMKLTDSEALIGNDAMGWTKFGRTKWDGTSHYHNVDITVTGPGSATFDYRPLHHGDNRCTVRTGKTGRLRFNCPEGCHAKIVLDGKTNVTTKAVNNRYDLTDVQAAHKIAITFVHDEGNVNLSSSGTPTIADLSALIAIKEGKAPMNFCYANADLNKNGYIDEEDIAVITDMILKNHTYSQALTAAKVKLENGHPYVDMGLKAFPNLRWATCNLGAETATDEGLSYAWAEVNEKEEYHRGNYRWMEGGNTNKLTKYSTGDDLTRVELADDPARKLWGGKWRMPTFAEMEALAKECAFKLISSSDEDEKYNKTHGHEFTSQNGNILFLRHCLYKSPYKEVLINTYGLYWTADLDPNNLSNARVAILTNSGISSSSYTRYAGMEIRPVFDAK